MLIKALISAWPSVPPVESLLPSAHDLYFQPSASHALLNALIALGLKGDVIVPAYTCERVVAAVQASGCYPRFVDIDLNSGTLDVNLLQALLPGRPAAVIATHMFGIPCDIQRIKLLCMSYGVPIIEDCALGAGTRVGGQPVGVFGDLALFSFGLGKTINFGYGGALRVNSPALRPAIESFFQQQAVLSRCAMEILDVVAILAGSRLVGRARYETAELIKSLLGRGSSVTSYPGHSAFKPRTHLRVLGVILGRLLAKLDSDQIRTHHRRIASVYIQLIRPTADVVPLRSPITDADILFPMFPLRVSNPAGLHAWLRVRGFDCGRFFSYSAAELAGDLQCPRSLELSKEILWLPVHGGVSVSAAQRLVVALNEWHASQ